MKQKQIQEPTKQQKKNPLAEKFEQIQPFREVKLKYRSCCGCGCYDEKVLRLVPHDSPLQNGDRIDFLEEDDQVV